MTKLQYWFIRKGQFLLMQVLFATSMVALWVLTINDESATDAVFWGVVAIVSSRWMMEDE